MPRERGTSTDSVGSTLQDMLAPPGSFNNLGAVAALDRHKSSGQRSSWVHRTVSPLSVGGLRQSTITLVQTSLGGGVLTLAYAMKLSGLGLGLLMLALLAGVAFLGMDTMMRGAIKMEAYDTATLLAKCVGSWSGPAMDLLLVLYGNGAIIAYFILLGDFLPAIARDAASLGVIAPLAVDATVLRRHCILSTLLVVVPLAIPKKLSALRYATPVALVAIVFTACTVVSKSPELYEANVGEEGFGDVEWFVADWGFFQSFSILLFAYNCHLNVIPVAAELVEPTDVRISKITFRVVSVELIFYALIATGGYLSFLARTDQNILTDYRQTTSSVTICRALLSFTILVGIPTNLLPTVRSLQGFVEACVPSLRSGNGLQEPLVSPSGEATGSNQAPTPTSPTSSAGSEVVRLCLTALCIVIQVAVAIAVPNVADVMGFLGASVGTVLMMVLPAVVLFKAKPAGFSSLRWWATAVGLIGATLISCAAIVVMLLQKMGRL